MSAVLPVLISRRSVTCEYLTSLLFSRFVLCEFVCFVSLWVMLKTCLTDEFVCDVKTCLTDELHLYQSLITL